MLYIQYDPSQNGAFTAVSSDLEPIVSSPTQQLVMPDSTQIAGMILDLAQTPPVLVPIFPNAPTDEQ